ncbi:rod shape-determining protein MreC [Clostridium sp. cel8]|jgi:rod shape-determining protein MreC|uniref:rod shape-determining protein MreC n=1 Tax=unclassified Clostridium TaxID=2614128 RepID=UPI0015F5B85E|nr:rod shape-determining protein MreC [Clostridium sp. cel8]MBA5849929.1 rod shape-determining protein MreC [Clostridium sp. cel8]
MKSFRNKLAVIVIVLSVTFLILISFSIKGNNVFFMRNELGVTFNSVQGVIYKFNNNIKQFFSFIINFSEVKKENEELIKKNSELENKLIDYNYLKNENANLREELNFKKNRSEYEYIGCDITGKGQNAALNQFIINRGSSDGIKKNMVAIVPEGLVGKVTYVGKNWAIIQSIVNENIAVGGEIQGISTKDEITEQGIVKGYKGTSNDMLAKMYYLPVKSKIKKGDTILTSGIDNSYPKGIKIGKVISVELDRAKVMKEAVIKPYVNFDKLEQVMVVVPKNEADIKY